MAQAQTLFPRAAGAGRCVYIYLHAYICIQHTTLNTAQAQASYNVTSIQIQQTNNLAY